LLETIKGFIKLTYKVGFFLYKYGRLFHIDIFMQVPIQEGIFNIHLMDFPIERGNKGKNKADKVHFGNRGEGFSISNSFNLLKTLSNKTSFMFINFSIWSKIGSVNPFTSTSFLPFGRGTRSHVSFVNNERYYSFIDVSQYGWHGASAKVSKS